jgi:hypothetical protein
LTSHQFSLKEDGCFWSDVSLGETVVFETVFLNNQQQPDQTNNAKSVVIDHIIHWCEVVFGETQTVESLS